MVNYTGLAATTKRLVEANGREVTFLRRDRTPANAAQPWRGPDATPTPPDGATATLTACFVDPGGSGFGNLLSLIPATLLATYDKVCLLAATSNPGVDMQAFDSITDQDRVWKIEKAGLLQPGDVPLLYWFGLKS